MVLGPEEGVDGQTVLAGFAEVGFRELDPLFGCVVEGVEGGVDGVEAFGQIGRAHV